MDDFASSLLGWYAENRRILPWREDPTPYHVFLSEIMLQQTRVDTVIPYYHRFLERFPSFEALAEADEEEVLVLWQGLGYYSRARNLLAAAKMVVSEMNGVLPADKSKLLRLPGVGEYVSHAVLSIAFNQPYAAVDGNLMRVYARHEAKAVEANDPKGKKECAAFLLQRMESPSQFNQALMDLGELVCLPHGEPKCASCPFARRCKAHLHGNPLDYPLAKKKNDVKKEALTVLLAFDSEGNIAIRKRQDQGLLASMYEFPNVPGKKKKGELADIFGNLQDIRFLGKAKHRFSHIKWDIDVYAASGVVDGATYVTLEELKRRYSLPTAFAKLLKFLT